MESLALLVALLLLFLYGSALLAAGLSFGRRKAMRVLTFVFAGLAIPYGFWLAIQLWSGNGLFVGGIPVVLGSFAIWNTLRVKARNASA